MKRLLDELKRAKFTFEVSANELADLEKILEKDIALMSKEVEGRTVCPRCGGTLVTNEKAFFCPWCGQRTVYVDKKDIPL